MLTMERAPSEEDRPEKAGFKRELNVVNATLLGLGTIVGAGIFVVIGTAAQIGGPAIILGFLTAGVIAALNAFAAVELGIVSGRTGGGYEFGRRLILPVVGFVAGWLFVTAGVAASAAFALTFGTYFRTLIPGVDVRLASALLVIVATAINYFGISVSVRVNNVLVVAKIASLVVFIVVALFAFRPTNFTPFFEGGWRGFMTATALLFFAYTGYGRPVTVVEEVQRPEQTLPRSIANELLVAAVLYVAVGVAALGAIGSSGLAASEAPLYTAAAKVNGTAAVVVSIGGLIAGTTVILTEIFGLARVVFAMARNADLPRWLDYIHPRHNVPTRAVVVLGGLTLVFVFSADLPALIASTSLFFLIYYVIVDLSALALGRKALYNPTIPALGAALSIIVATALPRIAIDWTVTAIAVGLIYYWLRWGTLVPKR